MMQTPVVAGTSPNATLAAPKLLRFALAAGAFAFLLGVVRAWMARFEIQPDGVVYLDLADRFAAADWHAAVNLYWSPLYPALLGLALRIVRPSSYWEFPFAHFVNAIILVAAFAAFWFLLFEMRAGDLTTTNSARSVPFDLWFVLEVSLFLWFALNLLGPWLVSPDLLLAAFVLASCGLLIRVRSARARWTDCAGLGFVLGFGYLAKAALFPLALVFFALTLWRRCKPMRISALLLAPLTFLAVAGPWVGVLSARKGSLSFGESGPLNYAWYVNGARRHVHWQGSPGQAAQHPTRRISTDPEAFEYAAPVSGTYPPWDDPAYWNSGLSPHFDLRQQGHALLRAAAAYGGFFLKSFQGVVIATFILLLLLVPSRNSRRKALTAFWPLVVIAVCAFAMYALVLVEVRYVAPFALVLWLAWFEGLRKSLKAEPHGAVRPVVSALAALAILAVAAGTAKDLRRFPQHHLQWQVAQELRGMGLHEGDRIAVLGWDIYWARVGRYQVIGEVPEPAVAGFWAADATKSQQILSAFCETGARSFVASPKPMAASSRGSASAMGLQPLAATGYFAAPLRDFCRR